jgi:iron complex outermembrane recepter protein
MSKIFCIGSAEGLIGGILAIGIATGFPHLAKSADIEPSAGLEEIIVTAQRRQENMQEVPISMSAITGATLENLGIRDFNDYAALIPNLSIGVGSGAGGAGSGAGVSSARAVAIRGVAGNNTTALYLDDTPVPLSLDPRVIDFDRVEVLRGPQGTLFGAGSMGGTIRIVTREPSLDQTSGKVDVEGAYVDHGGGSYSVNGTINVPIIPGNVALRASMFSAFDPGLFTRKWGGSLNPPESLTIPYPPGGVPEGQKDHVGAQQNTGVMVSLAITPSAIPGLTITPMFMYQHYNTNGEALADYTADNFVQNRPLDVPEEVEDRWSFAGLTFKQVTDIGRFVAYGSYFYRDTLDLEDTTEVTSILFYDLPYYVPAPLSNALITRTWTGEARFESDLKGPVDFVIGVYDSLSERQFVEELDAPGINAATGGAIGSDLIYSQNSPNADRQLAEFLDVTYKVTSALQLSAGVRRAKLNDQGTYIANGNENGGFSDAYSDHGETDIAPRYTAKYQIAPGQMLYASAAKGFRIGGVNSLLPPICDASLGALGITNGQSFKTDSLWSYEIGSKNVWADDRVSSRIAVYRIDWKGIQRAIFLPCTYDVVANSGAAVSTGGELELDLAPIPHLILNVAAGIENAKITEATVQSGTYVGQPLNEVPKWTGSVVAQYSIPVGARTGFIRGDWTYTGSRTSFNNIPPPEGLPLQSYSLVNLRAGISQGPWECALFARNLFNKLGVVGDELGYSGQLPDRPRLFVTRPRTIGLQLHRAF